MIRRFINKAIWLFVKKIPWKPILIWGPWVVIVLVTSFYGIENWRGNRALVKATEKASSKGVLLEYRNYLPQRSQDNPDLASLPGFDSRKISPLLNLSHSGRTGLAPPTSHIQDRRWQAKPADLRPVLATPPKSEEEAAKKLTRILKTEITLLNELREELDGEQIVFEFPSRFSIESFSNSESINCLSLVKSIREHFLVALTSGNFEEALENINLLVTFTKATTYPNLIELVTKSFYLRDLEVCIWEMNQSTDLTKKQLKTLSNILESISPLKDLQNALKGEMAYTLSSMKEFELDRTTAIEFSPLWRTPNSSAWKESLSEWSAPARLRAAPNGWFRHDSANFIDSYLPLTSSELVSWKDFDSKMKHASQTSSNSRFFDIPKMMDRILHSFLIFHREMATRLSLAQVGIKLEIHRLDFGSYPEKLSQLGIPIPEDPFRDGKKIQYRLLANKNPLLWSIGPNRVNEGGLPQIDDPKEGDIVWQLSPIPGLTESDLRKKLAKHRAR